MARVSIIAALVIVQFSSNYAMQQEEILNSFRLDQNLTRREYQRQRNRMLDLVGASQQSLQTATEQYKDGVLARIRFAGLVNAEENNREAWIDGFMSLLMCGMVAGHQLLSCFLPLTGSQCDDCKLIMIGSYTALDHFKRKHDEAMALRYFQIADYLIKQKERLDHHLD